MGGVSVIRHSATHDKTAGKCKRQSAAWWSLRNLTCNVVQMLPVAAAVALAAVEQQEGAMRPASSLGLHQTWLEGSH